MNVDESRLLKDKDRDRDRNGDRDKDRECYSVQFIEIYFLYNTLILFPHDISSFFFTVVEISDHPSSQKKVSGLAVYFIGRIFY